MAQASSRFYVVTSEEIENDMKARMPVNTRNKMKWAMRIFESWLCEWKARLDDTLKVLKPIEEFSRGDLNHCLVYFFAEVRKQDGELYPPSTLKAIAAMIQLYFREELKWEFSLFLDRDFQSTQKSLDAQMKKAAKAGAVKPTKRACPISFELENQLWTNHTFGYENPEQLLNNLIYHFGIHFSLRACQEQKDLEYGANSQIVLHQNDGEPYIEYVERISKNKSFGLKTARMEPKCTKVYENKCESRKCVIKMYREYVSHRPETHGAKGCTAFYLTPLPQKQVKGPIWFKAIPLGIHAIEKRTKTIMEPVDANSFYSNTSLRRTSKTRLVEAGIPQEVVTKKTGRISEVADRVYIGEHVYQEKMSMALYGSEAPQTSSENVNGMNRKASISFTNCSFNNCTF